MNTYNICHISFRKLFKAFVHYKFLNTEWCLKVCNTFLGMYEQNKEIHVNKSVKVKS